MELRSTAKRIDPSACGGDFCLGTIKVSQPRSMNTDTKSHNSAGNECHRCGSDEKHARGLETEAPLNQKESVWGHSTDE